MEIRTPDLLHAMEVRTVHQGPGEFTPNPTEQRIRTEQAASVHESSPRTVTSLVTSQRPDHAHPDGPYQVRENRPRIEGCVSRSAGSRPSPTARLQTTIVISGPAARPGPMCELGLIARQMPGSGQCTSREGDRTTGAHAACTPLDSSPPELLPLRVPIDGSLLPLSARSLLRAAWSFQPGAIGRSCHHARGLT
jgi:hypothetical protein